MGLQRRNFIQIGATVSVFAILLIILANIFLIKGNERIEMLEAKRNMERAVTTIQFEMRALTSTVSDWAFWDETYDFARGRNASFAEDNLTSDTFSNLNLDLIAIIDTGGTFRYSGMYDETLDAFSPVPPGILEAVSEAIPDTAENMEGSLAGLVAAEGLPFLVVTSPILKSDRTGPEAGLLIFARTLDAKELEKISQMIQLPVSYALLGSDEGFADSKEFERAKKALVEDSVAVIPLSGEKVGAYKKIDDIHGNPVLILRVEGLRTLYRLGQSQIVFFLVSLALIGGTIAAMTLRSMKKRVVDPVLKLKQALSSIQSTGDLGRQIPPLGEDEIAELVVSVNALLHEVQALRLGLEDRVRERTEELEKSNRELSAFAYSVSHDLRSPLRSMEGFSGLILSDPENKLSEKSRHFLERIGLSSRRMWDLIEGLLLLARISRDPIRWAVVDLGNMAREIADKAKAQESGRAMEFDIEAGLSALGDPALVKMLLEILVGNAVKFTQREKVAHISVGSRNGPEGKVFFVEDNGVGFDMAYRGKLFLPFQSLHGNDEFPGIGIGLAIAQRIVARHEGRLWAESVPGEGASFFFTLDDAGRRTA